MKEVSRSNFNPTYCSLILFLSLSIYIYFFLSSSVESKIMPRINPQVNFGETLNFFLVFQFDDPLLLMLFTHSLSVSHSHSLSPSFLFLSLSFSLLLFFSHSSCLTLTGFPRIHSSKFITRELVANYSLLYTIQGTDSSLKPFMLCSHLDVVPVEEAKWTVPAFEGMIKDGNIYGRGTLDVKDSLMVRMRMLVFHILPSSSSNMASLSTCRSELTLSLIEWKFYSNKIRDVSKSIERERGRIFLRERKREFFEKKRKNFKRGNLLRK